MRGQRSNGLPVVLVVEDDSEIREQMRWALATDYRIHEALNRRTALAAVKKVLPNLVLLDLGLPPHSDVATEGLATLRDLLRAQPNAKVIVVTGNSTRENARAAIDGGAYDFIEKPVDVGLLKVVLQHPEPLEDDVIWTGVARLASLVVDRDERLQTGIRPGLILLQRRSDLPAHILCWLQLVQRHSR